MPPAPEKPKEDRVKETIMILRQLQDIGIATSDPGYEEVKTIMSAWVRDGGASTHTITFPRTLHRGTLELPNSARRSAGLRMKVIT